MQFKLNLFKLNWDIIKKSGLIISIISIVGLILFIFDNNFKTPNIKPNEPEILINPTQTLEISPTIIPSISNIPTVKPTPQITIKLSPTTAPTMTNKPTSTPIITTKPVITTTPILNWSEVIRGEVNEKQVIFTFDAGSGIQSAQKVLDILKNHNVKGTFFVTGKWAENNPELVKSISQNGNEIFNHTYDHPYLTQISDTEIINELNKTNDIIFSLTNKSSKPYFRAPYGDRNTHVLNIAKNQGYRSVYWTIDALDWKESLGETADQVKDIIYKNLKPGNIYLMHIGDNITGQILDGVFQYIEAQGYKINSLTQGL